MQKVSIGEVTLAYEEVGEGSPLVQLHGAGFGHHNFGAVTPYLADHFRVLNLDQRGFGESDRPEQEYTFEVWADDVAAFMDALGIERAHVHGTSMGGPVAMTFAVRHPDRLNGLVVSCSLAKPDRYARISYELVRSLMRTYGVGSSEVAQLIGLYALSRSYVERPEGEEALRLIAEILEVNNSPEILDQAWLRLIEMDLRPLLPRIEAPTLVIAASEDTIITPDRMAGDGAGSLELVEGIPNAELVMIQGSNHSHLFEKPGESATAIIGFLRRVESPADPIYGAVAAAATAS